MRVLITGANGFMGTYLVNELNNVHQVIAGVRDKRSTEFSGEVREIPDLTFDADWSGLFQNVDVIVHLAARVHVMNETAKDPLEEFMEVNTRAVSQMAHAAVEQGVKRFIFMSTIKVNGEGDANRPYSDTDLPNPVDPYGLSKWKAEESLKKICETSQMELIILRSPVVYGPGVKGNIELFSRLVSLRLPLPFGLVKNRRTMLSLKNLGIWVRYAIHTRTIPDHAVLMGDPKPISTKMLAESLGAGIGQRVLLFPVPVFILNFCAALVGKKSLADRLFGNLEVAPSFDAFLGIYEELVPSEVELKNCAVVPSKMKRSHKR